MILYDPAIARGIILFFHQNQHLVSRAKHTMSVHVQSLGIQVQVPTARAGWIEVENGVYVRAVDDAQHLLGGWEVSCYATDGRRQDKARFIASVSATPMQNMMAAAPAVPTTAPAVPATAPIVPTTAPIAPALAPAPAPALAPAPAVAATGGPGPGLTAAPPAARDTAPLLAR